MKNSIIITIIGLTILTTTSCFRTRCIDGNNEIVSQYRILDENFNGISLKSDFKLEIIDNNSDTIEIEAESNLMKLIITDVKEGILIVKTPRNRCIRPNERVKIHCNQTKLQSITLDGSGSIICGSLYSPSMKFKLNGSGDMSATKIDASLVNCIIDGSGNIDVDSVKGEMAKYIISGSGNISNESTRSQNVYMKIDGSGKISNEINTPSVEVVISGSGDINSAGNANDSKITIESSGNFDGFGLVTKQCKAKVSGSGDIKIHVEETLDATIDGSGSIIYEGSPNVHKDINGSGNVSKR